MHPQDLGPLLWGGAGPDLPTALLLRVQVVLQVLRVSTIVVSLHNHLLQYLHALTELVWICDAYKNANIQGLIHCGENYQFTAYGSFFSLMKKVFPPSLKKWQQFI